MTTLWDTMVQLTLATQAPARPNHLGRARRLVARWLPFALAAGAAGLAGGCLSRPPLVEKSFGFVAPPQEAVSPAPRGRVLGIRRVIIAAPYDSQSLTYRTGEYSFERDPYSQLLAPPSESLGAALQALLRNSGQFREVAEPDSLLQADALVEVCVDEFYGDFRDRTAPQAVLAIRFLFFRGGLAPQPSLLEKGYERRIPMSARTAAALAAGWNEGLRQIVAAVTADYNAQPQTITKGE